MELNQIYEEPCLDTLAKMQDESIACVITSPPYWQLRDYGYEGQWGLEPTFQEYLEHLWSMMDEIYRVLKPQGTVWINLGDTYSTQGGQNTKAHNTQYNSVKLDNKMYGVPLVKNLNMPSKCLLLIPHRFAIGCIDRGWIVRNDIIWAKRNGMPESVTDRFSKKHEYFFFMVKSEKYYFDLDAIKDSAKPDKSLRDRDNTKLNNTPGRTRMGGLVHNSYTTKNPGSVSDFWEGANKPTFDEYMKQCADYYNSQDDFFDIPTKPSSSKHYASYNDSLLTKPVLAGCPEDGIIYDPFMGTGSTAEVALRTSRKFIGSEMSAEYCKIAEKRLRKFTVESLF